MEDLHPFGDSFFFEVLGLLIEQTTHINAKVTTCGTILLREQGSEIQLLIRMSSRHVRDRSRGSLQALARRSTVISDQEGTC